jgi:transcriptional regulator with XRE-family HTH domain
MVLENAQSMPIGRRRGRGIPLTEVDRRRIAAARLARGWSVAELANRVGLHQSTLYRLENGTLRSTPRLSAIYAALDLPSERIGKAEADEEELVAMYRDLKHKYPNQAMLFMNLARSWATRVVRQRIAS